MTGVARRSPDLPSALDSVGIGRKARVDQWPACVQRGLRPNGGTQIQPLAQPYRFWYGCAMGAEVKYRDLVREIALGEYGFITTKQAVEFGVPAVELRKLAGRGALINVAYGIYRVPDAPASAFDQFAEALLRAGEGSYLRGHSVLALFGLADVNPRRVWVVSPKRTRAKLPGFMELTVQAGELPALTRYQGLLAMTVAEAILDCRGQIERSRLLDAAREARREGLLTRAEHAKVLRELRRPAVGSQARTA